MIRYNCRQKTNSRFRLPMQIIAAGILALIIFCAGFHYLRTNQKTNPNDATVLPSPFRGETTVANLPTQSTPIKNLSNNLEIGEANRGIENKILYHTVKISLQEINREAEYYEGWLVRQSPYDFFSTGEMVTNDLGEFILEWAGEHDDIVSYDRVVITRELRDDNPAPSEHVAEGMFGK